MLDQGPMAPYGITRGFFVKGGSTTPGRAEPGGWLRFLVGLARVSPLVHTSPRGSMKSNAQKVHEEVYTRLREELAQVGLCVLLISWLTKQRAISTGAMLPVRMLVDAIESTNVELINRYYTELERIMEGGMEDELPGVGDMMKELRDQEGADEDAGE